MIDQDSQGTTDHIFCFQSLHELDQRVEAIREYKTGRVGIALQPNGYCFISCTETKENGANKD